MFSTWLPPVFHGPHPPGHARYHLRATLRYPYKNPPPVMIFSAMESMDVDYGCISRQCITYHRGGGGTLCRFDRDAYTDYVPTCRCVPSRCVLRNGSSHEHHPLLNQLTGRVLLSRRAGAVVACRLKFNPRGPTRLVLPRLNTQQSTRSMASTRPEPYAHQPKKPVP